MFRKYIHKTITLIIIPLFLLSNITHADGFAPEQSTLAPYSIFKLIVEDEAQDLGKLTETGTPASAHQERVAEFGRAWVAECARRLATKMVARVDAQRGSIGLDSAETELIRTIGEWARKNNIPKYRRKRLSDAIRAEFAKYKFFEETKTHYREAYAAYMPITGEAGTNTYELPFLSAPETFATATVERPKEAPAGGVVVEIESCYICNTDVQYYLGTRGAHDPDARGVLGHEAVGRISKIGEGVSGYKIGDRVRLAVIISDPRKSATLRGVPHMDAEKVVHGHQVPGFFAKDAIILREGLEAGLVQKIPNTVSSKYAALSEPVSCALYDLMLTKADIDGRGEKLVIWGAGFQGIMHAILASRIDEVRYNKIILFDIEDEKIQKARETLDSLGLYHVEIYNATESDMTDKRIEELYAHTDATIFAYSPSTQEATEKAYQRACALSRKGAVVSVFGGIRDNWPAISGRKVHSNQISIVGNSGASIKILDKSYKLIEEGVLPESLLDSLISAEFPLEELDNAFKLASSGKAMKVRVVCNEDRPAESPEDQLKNLMRRAKREGLTNARISIRVGENFYFIDEEAAADDAYHEIMDMTEGVTYQRSPDMAVHGAIYRENPEIMCVVQSDPPTARAVIDEGKTLPPLSPDFVAVLKPREDNNYSLPLIDAEYDTLPKHAAEALGATEGTSILTTAAGVISCGKNPLEAYYRNKLVDDSAKTFQAAEHMGKVNHLTNTDADKLAKAYFEKYRQDLLSGAAREAPPLETVAVEYNEEEIQALRAQLVETGREIAKMGLVVGPGGNTSAITEDRKVMLIKASGFSFENMMSEEYIGVDMATGTLVKGLEGPDPARPLKPSSEVHFHRAIYLKRPDVRAVVHTHPPFATGIASAERTLKDIPRIPYTHPGGDEVDAGLPKAVSDGLSSGSNCLLMTNHGLITVGDNLHIALDRNMQLEKEAEGKITNEKAFQERCQSHREADEALKALGETKGKSLDEIKEILKFRNEVMFRLEELLLESERKPISSVKNLQPADIIFNIITKEVFEYGTGDRKIPDGDLAQYVTLAPLSISVEQRLLRNELVTRLYDQSADASQIHEAALLQLKAMERRGILPKPFEMLDTFQHCHTDHSYSVDLLPDGSVGYRTPSAFAWRAYQLGLLLSGQCDHDITNFDEFLNAAAILELRNPTCAYEQRVRPYGTEFMKMDINSPGNPGEIYMVVHSVSENGNEQLDMPDGVREAKIKRFKRNIRYLNALDLSDYLLLDYDKHIRSRTRVNNPTERHLAEAVAGRIYEKFTDNITYGKWEPVYAFVEELINKAVQPATPFALDDTGRSDIRNASDFTVFIRNNLVTPLKERFPPTKKECIDLTAFVDYAHSKGYLVYYPYLGDTKGCEAERRENVRKLFRLMKAAGVDGIAFMHNRNSDEELEGVLQIALEEGLKCRCNGMDVNKERMPFLYFDISCRKEYVDEAFRIYRGERERREPNEYRTTFHDEVTKRYHDHYASLIVRPGVVRPGQGVTTYEVPVLTDYMDPEKNKGKVKYVTMRQSEAPDGGVIVAIESCAICGTDLNIWRGRRGRDQQMLERDIFIQGHEAVGRIVKVGKGIKDYKVGQRVVLQTIISDGNCSTCGKDLKSMCDERRAKSHQLPGYFSPEITFFPEDVKAGNLIPVSDEPKADHLSLTEPIACALYSLLRSKNPEIEALRGRQEKLVIWGTGFQGIVHAMLASLVDEVKYKKVILFGRNEAKNARARKILDSLGLYDVKIYNNKKLSTEEIDRICGDDTDTNVIAFSPQDGESAAELYLDIARHTRPGGAVNLYGGLDKDWPVIAPRMAHTRHIRFIGNSGAATEVLEKVARLIENKTIPPNALEQFITHRFPLSKTQEAFEAAGARDALKVVVRCSEHAKSQDGPQTKEAAFTCGGENVRATYTVSPGFGKTLTLDMQLFVDETSLGSVKFDMRQGGVIIGKDHVGNKEILRAIAKKDNGQEFLLRLFTLAGDVAQSHNLAPQCVILYGIFDVHLPQSLEVLQKEAEETLPIVEAAESIGVRSTAIFWGGDAGEEAKLYEGTPPPMVMEYTAAWADQTSSQYITLTSMKQELERRTSDAVPTRTTEEVDEKTGDIATHRVLDIAGSEPVDLAKTVVFMKKDLAEGFIREGHTGDVILAQEYKKMKQELRRLFNNRDQAIVEVATTEELVDGANAAMQGGDIKVIILDDGALTEKMPAGAIQGKAGEAYCVVRADSSRFSRDKGLVQFVNLHAMVMMGVGILNRDEWLFQSAYQTFTGKKAPQGLLEKMQQGALWIVRALPRMVRLTDTMRDSEILQRLFAVAA